MKNRHLALALVAVVTAVLAACASSKSAESAPQHTETAAPPAAPPASPPDAGSATVSPAPSSGAPPSAAQPSPAPPAETASASAAGPAAPEKPAQAASEPDHAKPAKSTAAPEKKPASAPEPAAHGKGAAYQQKDTPEVAALWGSKCATCHGKDGKGETKMGLKMGVASMVSKAWQSEFSDGAIRKATVDGIKREKDGKKQEMKPFAALSAAQLDGLVAHIRMLAE